jgi:uncharacterized protein YgfB (UPF0149 family)
MDLPDFDESVRALESLLTMDEMAESHGLMCGILCAQPDLGPMGFKNACLARELPVPNADEGTAVMQLLLDASKKQMHDADMAVSLWVPEDDEPLAVRAASLAAWCSGFLTGLAETCGEQLMQISDDVSEIVTDIGEIARADAAAEEEGESEEIAYAEIVEFVRVAILLVQEELRGPRDDDSVH